MFLLRSLFVAFGELPGVLHQHIRSYQGGGPLLKGELNLSGAIGGSRCISVHSYLEIQSGKGVI